MIYIPRWKIFLVAALCVLAMLYAAPNLLSEKTRADLAQNYASWMPIKGVSLGLDLRGGSHLLLRVDVEAVEREKIADLASNIRTSLRQAKIPFDRVTVDDRQVRVILSPAADDVAARATLRGMESGLLVDGSRDITVAYTDVTWRDMRTQILGQSIEIVRRRVDEAGTRESTIVRQGEDRILVQIPGLDDPARIKELLGRTAKLSFHLVTSDFGGGLSTRTLPMKENPGETLNINRRPIMTGDMLTQASAAFDSTSGQPIVNFRLNGTGAKRFCDVTREHTGQPFAIVLDDVIISAPRINEPICGGAAMISGRFSVQETSDLALLLRAGALPAPLEVMEERTIGPSLGSDSVAAGKTAATVALILVMMNMIAAYGLFGIFAAVALFFNVIMIFALLSFIGATLTLPGIAGIVLTIGMAVDANVLIFERIREELRLGKSPVAALDAGYNRAMGTIIDSNLTTLIAGLVLFLLGAGPIKGFAITMSIGIVTSIFSAVTVTRIIVMTWYARTRPKTLVI